MECKGIKRIDLLRELAEGLPDSDIQWAVEMLESARKIMIMPEIDEVNWAKYSAERVWLNKLEK